MSTGPAPGRPRVDRPLRAVFVCAVLAAQPAYPGNAQPTSAQPSAGQMPSVIYPSRDPDTAPPEPVPGTPAPQPAPVVTSEPAPVQYIFLDGVWGYRDRNREFHPIPGHPPRRLEEPRPPIAAAHPEGVGRRLEPPHTDVNRYNGPSEPVGLPNHPGGAIVGPPIVSRDPRPPR